MAMSSQECLAQITNFCENCQEVVLDDSSAEFEVRYDEGKPIPLETEWRGKHETRYFIYDDFPRLPKLEVSLRQGCNFCRYVRDIISSKHTMDFLERHFDVSATDPDTQEIQITISFDWSSNGLEQTRGHLCTNISLKHTKCDLILWSHVTAPTGCQDIAESLQVPVASGPLITDEQIREMKSIIPKCKDHGHALPGVEYVPERLLDVREQVPKLVQRCGTPSKTQDRTPRYAALSYCWGTSQEAKHQLTTTRQTIAQRQAGIQYDEMSPVLRDAVHVTRILDIPFLWIDALCILQDDTSDWERQCTHMDGIYGHAEVTLVAASSNSCRESFLQPEAPRAMLPFTSTRRPGLSGLLQVDFSGCTMSHEIPQSFNGMTHSRLATRGWAVQERILSTRMILFGRHGAHFFCPSYSSAWSYRLVFDMSRVRNAETKKLYYYWSILLRTFRDTTADSFTQPTDLLPSLSGLATYFGGRLKDQYCAGHWHKDLYRSLMWWYGNRWSGNLRLPREPKTRHVSRICSTSPYIVPSWSQLGKGDTGTNFRWWFEDAHCLQRTLKLDAHISLTGENPFGSIRDAELEIRSHTMCVRTATMVKINTVRSIDITFYKNCWSVDFVRRDKSSVSCCVCVDYELKTEEASADANEWKWVLLGVVFDEQPFGLLLHSINGSKWCRVGIFFSQQPPRDGHGKQQRMQVQDFTEWSDVETIMII